jgi:hypothetical protein
MEDLIKAKTVAKEKQPLQTQKDRIWQEELLGAFLPQVQEESLVQVQETPKPVKVNEDENSKAKIIYLDDNNINIEGEGSFDVKSKKDTITNNEIVSIIQLSVLVTILTAFLLWFFEPTFIQSKMSELKDQHSSYNNYDTNYENTESFSTKNTQKLKNEDILNYSETYYTSKLKLIFCSILAGVFAFTVLYSLPRNV